MKRLRDMNNKELEKVNRILLVIVLILEIGIIIENIVWYNDYSPAVILSASLAIACVIYTIIDQIKRDKFNNKKGE